MKSVKEAIRHHKKHGDMDGHTCLLAECPLHYPKKVEGRTMTINAETLKKQKIKELKKLTKKLGQLEHLEEWELESMLWILGHLVLDVVEEVEG